METNENTLWTVTLTVTIKMRGSRKDAQVEAADLEDVIYDFAGEGDSEYTAIATEITEGN